jgi:hypothetical protein
VPLTQNPEGRRLDVLHAAWEALRAVAWVMTWAMYAVYVAASVAFLLAILALPVTALLAAIPDRKPPRPEGRDARP